jgi:hypothetical protein
MLASDCLVAAVLLTCPADLTLPDEALAWAETCRSSLLALALDAQLVDAREPLTHFTRPGDAAADLRSLQRRFQQYAFAPLVEESLRFPPRDAVLDFLLSNRAYRGELQVRMILEPAQAVHLDLAMHEAEELHHIWILVAEARWSFLYVPARRQALQQLRDLVGDRAFYSGHLPPYLPVWRMPITQ